MDNKKIGEFICTLRKNRGLTQKDLADQLGITDKAVSKWERGAGYPDISMLKPLADTLGTSVTELLDGETSDDISDSETKDITNALDYANKIMTLKRNTLSSIMAVILVISLSIGIFTTVIVNIAVNHCLSWSLLAIDGCVMGGCLFLPPLLWKKRGILTSLCLLTVLLLPFLAIIQSQTSLPSGYSSWLWKLGFPISSVWLICLWMTAFLFYKARINIWFKTCITLVLCTIGNILTNYMVDSYLHLNYFDGTRDVANIIILICFIAASIVCFVMGLFCRKSRN